MKYHDKQHARKGDTFIIGTFGTCRVESVAHVATVRNVCTGEVFDLDSLQDADLIDRADTPTHHYGLYRTAMQCVLGDLGEVLVTHYADEPQALAALASLGDGYEIRPVTPDGQPIAAPASPLARALFSAEAVAHLRGYEREILPLADLARGMQARIDELESVARELLELVDGFHMHTYAPNKSSDWKQQARAREVLARPVSPLTPDNIKS